MFTGIVEAVGEIKQVSARQGDITLCVDGKGLSFADVALGDSIATNGVCLTVTSFSGGFFWANVSRETVSCSTFKDICVGQKVNLEKALTLQSRLGGHIVAGHVDGVGKIQKLSNDGDSVYVCIAAPEDLARYIAHKGSICVDGISLTVNGVKGNAFELNLIPHTAGHSTATTWTVGQSVNLEVDLVARHIERLLQFPQSPDTAKKESALSKDFLAQNGFLKP
ncbi:MAG: riboflavin synthase [Gammaproteobacteria bacterium]|nr:MAG: riboflavin synthase [Gammaproteobacteria bacterium]